uniref:Uncharacterized protein n=1 Tax=Cacopsylla melanoneura TaxID=428564 RepID=A0A8D8SSS4_9HEMI
MYLLLPRPECLVVSTFQTTMRYVRAKDSKMCPWEMYCKSSGSRVICISSIQMISSIYRSMPPKHSRSIHSMEKETIMIQYLQPWDHRMKNAERKPSHSICLSTQTLSRCLDLKERRLKLSCTSIG